MNPSAPFTFIDLFAGIGGFKLALEKNGGRSLGFSEINKDAIATYRENFNGDLENNFGDIRTIKGLPSHDLLTAGVPCQSWSIAGKNLGFDDDRGQLWNDTICLLEQSRPKAFIFENVKGLVDPRNKKALSYILERISEAGYHAHYHIINSYDYGVLQNRVRVYIVGFLDQAYFDRFELPLPLEKKERLGDLLGLKIREPSQPNTPDIDLFAQMLVPRSMSLSSENGFNDYFLFNDLRNGDTTVHSWDILDTTDQQRRICYLLLKNRRKKVYGKLDGNPLSVEHFKTLDSKITQTSLDELVALDIFSPEEYLFSIHSSIQRDLLSDDERTVLDCAHDNRLVVDDLKGNQALKKRKISWRKILEQLKEKQVIQCIEIRYDFKNTKISKGLFGVNRLFLPHSNIFPTLVASDTNDYVALEDVTPTTAEEYKETFLSEIYNPKKYRKISKREACLIQGFPEDYILPESRVRWMKLVGNSVSVPVVEMLCNAIIKTGVFDFGKQQYETESDSKFNRVAVEKHEVMPTDLFETTTQERSIDSDVGAVA